MALYDMYEQFRDPNFSAAEQAELDAVRELDEQVRADPDLSHEPGGIRDRGDGIFKPYPLIGTKIDIAKRRAEAQFRGHPAMPEDADISVRFPGVDPVGKYSVIDMKFAQREAAILSTLESRSPEVQAYAKGLMDRRASRKPEDAQFYQRQFMMKETAKTHRTLTRASKLCPDADGRRLLHQQARGMEAGLAVEQYDKLLQGIEYAAGVRQGPVPREITDFYRNTLQTELDMGMVAAARSMDHVPAQLHVEFQDLDHKLVQRSFANPRNWGKSPQEIAEAADNLDVDTISGVIPPYAQATADRVIDPLFRDMEKAAPPAFQGRAAEKAGFGIDIEFSRGDLISIDGMTVREKMLEDYKLSGHNPEEFGKFYQENVREMTNRYVSAGLMAGKRVEAFVPDKFGKIPAEPTQITKTGYEPSPLKPEKFNAWQRHFAKHGYFKEKVARQQEYERVMAARERMKAKAMSSEQARRQERAEAMRDAAAYSHSLSTANPAVKNLFFAKVMDGVYPELAERARGQWEPDEVRTFVAGEDGRVERVYGRGAFQELKSKMRAMGAAGGLSNFDRSEPVDVCVCMLAAQGHSIRDIMDPNKLQAERDAAAKEFMEHASVNDQEWFGRVTFAGQRAMLQQADRMTRGIDLTADSSMRTLVEVAALTHAGFGANQMLSEKGAMEGYLMAAIEAKGGDLALGSTFGEAQSHKLCDVSLSADYLVKGLRAQSKLTDPAAQCDSLTIMDFAAARMVGARLKPGASFVEQAQVSEQTSFCAAAAGMSLSDSKNPASLHQIEKTVLSPKNRAAIAREAASGRLAACLDSAEMTLTAATGRGATSTDFRDAMVRQPDGTLVKQRTEFQKQNFDVSSNFSSARQAISQLVKEAPERTATASQAQQQKAPHKQAPQAGGLHK